MFIDVVRKEITANSPETFQLKISACSFQVKNFTDGAVLVCLDHWNEGESVMIGAGMCEVINSNPDFDRGMTRTPTNKVVVKGEQAGLVEVLRFD